MCIELDKEPYNDYPYLIYPQNPLRIKFGTINPTLRVFVRQRDYTFGDDLPLDLAGLRITARIYSNEGILIAIDPAVISDIYRGEIECQFSQFDFEYPGIYYLEFYFKDIDDSIFVLPDKNRVQLIVY